MARKPTKEITLLEVARWIAEIPRDEAERKIDADNLHNFEKVQAYCRHILKSH
jgi:hypothetical protein